MHSLDHFMTSRTVAGDDYLQMDCIFKSTDVRD